MLIPHAPGFDQPLALLAACHERILRECETAARLVESLRAHGLTGEARAAAASVRRYFGTAGDHHHQDEEEDLFPLLRGDPPLRELIEALTADHRRLDAAWQALEPLLAAPETIRDLDAFGNQVAEFKELYAGHIARENNELLPRAADLLPPAVLTVLGERMARRRGVMR